MNNKHLILLVAGLLAAFPASANMIEIPTVFVGDAGNANDSTGFGKVSYDYHIGTYEVTNGQYATFLNAVAATDTYWLYNSNMGSSRFGGITREGTSGSFTYSVKSGFDNKPVNYVSFWDAARFANWLTTGDTETGVYVLDERGISNNTITRNAAAWTNGGVAIASEDEWYKAAYYDGSGGYWLYPTQSNTAPTAIPPDNAEANSANYYSAVGTVTDVGAYTISGSYFGTFDQGGNLWEWNDMIRFVFDRGKRGGSFLMPYDNANELHSSIREWGSPTAESYTIGFRVSSLAPIPEPAAYAAILGCLGLFLRLIKTRRQQNCRVGGSALPDPAGQEPSEVLPAGPWSSIRPSPVKERP